MAKLYWPRPMGAFNQGDPEWYRLRAGIPTSSEFASVMTPVTRKPSEARHGYACRILGARLLNWQAESLEKVETIAAGKANEPFAVRALEEIAEMDTLPVAFVTSADGRFGCSPDRVAQVAENAESVGVVVEAKCPTIPVQFARLLFPDHPKVAGAYKCQRQGHLLVCEADTAIFCSYQPQMPLYYVETGRDEPFLAALADCLERFSDELEAWEAKARELGLYQAFSDIRTPLDAEYGDQTDPEAEMQRWLGQAEP
jgi:hypothetical protein